jgi:hypothetical protein
VGVNGDEVFMIHEKLLVRVITNNFAEN